MNANRTTLLLVLFTLTRFMVVPLPSQVWADPTTQAEGNSATGEWNVDQLIIRLAKQRKETVSFEETTFSAMLTEPLKTRGTLKFTPPARLEKHVTDPYDERYVIDGDNVLYEKNSTRVSKNFSLEDYPVLRVFVEVFRSSFAGDPVTLKRFYKATLEGKPRQWSLILHPQDVTIQSIVQSVRLSGEGGHITRIETRSPDGDRSVLVIQAPGE
ncbi:MAG: outer membrane lipoprotein carrier protein LolA [Nitrospiraceae bacterium]|nr:outer membrane lipoprotein carrier protein LolA [Nitrospiraceae bacterium]